MAIEFNNTPVQYINFGTPDLLNNLSLKTMCVWCYLNSISESDTIIDKSDQAIIGWTIRISSDNKIEFFTGFSTIYGIWKTDASPSASSWFHLAVSYDNTSVDNDPIIYINGAHVAITETSTPYGTIRNDSFIRLCIGASYLEIETTLNGQTEDPRIYNVILTQPEIEEICNSRCERSISRGLVFAPKFYGAAGLSSFDGATLSSANTIIDRISGVQGIPSGSPIGRGNTIQRIY